MKTYTTMDKSLFKHGPWNGEPDKAQWIDEKTNLDCLIVCNRMGALCGYVGVPKHHQYFGKDYDEVRDVFAHGGLSFSGECREAEDERKGICHSEECAANKKVWWFGFDCAHAGDLVPSFGDDFEGAEYRCFSYVKIEVEYLARQLLEVSECNAQ